MRLLLVGNLYPPHFLGGYEILCRNAALELRERGHEVEILTSDWGVGRPRSEEEDRIPVHRRLRLEEDFHRPFRMDRRRRRAVARFNRRETLRWIQRTKPDLVFFWSQLRLTAGPLRAAADSGLPAAWTLNDPHAAGLLAAPPRPRPRGLLRYLADRTWDRSAALPPSRLPRCTVISASLRDELVSAGLPFQEARVIYQGIPLEQFPLKAEPGSIHVPLRVLYTGQLHPWKGVHTLLEAVRLAGARLGPGALEVTLAGTGEDAYLRRLERLAEGPARVRFLGRVAPDRVSALYREHDLFVFPSTWREPFGLTHLEAMASGTPVLSTTGGGPGEFLVDGENALTFPAESPVPLASALLQLHRDADTRVELARNARRLVEERFTLERYLDELEDFLHETLHHATSQDHRDPAPLRPARLGRDGDRRARDRQAPAPARA